MDSNKFDEFAQEVGLTPIVMRFIGVFIALVEKTANNWKISSYGISKPVGVKTGYFHVVSAAGMGEMRIRYVKANEYGNSSFGVQLIKNASSLPEVFIKLPEYDDDKADDLYQDMITILYYLLEAHQCGELEGMVRDAIRIMNERKEMRGKAVEFDVKITPSEILYSLSECTKDSAEVLDLAAFKRHDI